MQKILNRLKKKQDKLQKLKGEKFLDQKLKNYFHTEIIYISSDIGGEKLSHKQAEGIVGQCPNFKPIAKNNKTLLQTKGQKEALEFIEDFAAQKGPIDIYIICKVHKLIMQEAWPEIAGQYRQENMELKKSSALLPHHSRVPEEMYFLNQYLIETQKNLEVDDTLGICEFFSTIRYKLAWIHPFRDGNGRVARFVLNLIARRYKLPYILTPATKLNDRMWQAIQKADQGDLNSLIEFNLELLGDSYDKIIRYWQKGRLPNGSKI